MYDGLYTAYGVGVSRSTAEADTMSQRIRGFYKSAGPSARITHVVGTGGNNQKEQITVTSSPQRTITMSNDPFPRTSPSSDRSWGNPTYELNPLMPGTTDPNDRYGETVTTSVSATNPNPAACRAWAAVIFSTQVADVDHDGLPDGLEDAPGGLKDPDGTQLPDLSGMGAKSTNQNSPHPDLFVEYNATYADPGTKWGLGDAPYPNTSADCYDAATQSCTDGAGHHHIPTPEVLKRLGDRYAAHGITVHFDVGKIGNPNNCANDPLPHSYHCLGVVPHTDWVDDYTSTAADVYLVGNAVGTNLATLARGGELIKEVACGSADPQCNFPRYPGTVGWKVGLLALRNAPVGNNGEELNPDLTGPNGFEWVDSPTSQHRLRFDRERRPYFHYGLNAHTRGYPSSPLPCLVNGQPADYLPNSTTCGQADNPQFHVPSGSRGLADLPGRNMLLTLGLWDEFVGRPFSRAGALFHELGHNMYLWHSGTPVAFGNANQQTVIPPNCNPNILSSMSYLYSIHGLFDPNGFIQVDYSGQQLSNQAENALLDGAYFTTPSYQRAWYAPADSALASDEGVQAATRFCSGQQFGSGQPAHQMARVVSDTVNQQTGEWSIDWNGDKQVDPAPADQDSNFDGALGQPFSGFNDWANIRLDQISANGLGGGSEDFMLFSAVAADDLVTLGGDDLVTLGGDDLIVMAGDDLVSFGGDDLLVLAGDDLLVLAGDDDLINYAGDDLVSLGGDDLVTLGGDDLIVMAGDVQPEPTYAGAKGLGRTAPHGVTACIVGSTGCISAAQFTPNYHRIAVSFNTTAIVGHIEHYQVQRKRADSPGGAWEDVVGTNALRTNVIIDPAVLPTLDFTYRVRAHFNDPAAHSAWAYLPAPIHAVNDLPAPQADSYVTTKNRPITATASGTPPPPGVLGISCNAQSNGQIICNPTVGADRSSDNPTAAYVAKRAVLVSGPVIKDTNTPIGTLVFNANGDGGFTFTPPPPFDGFVTFQYKANDGFWSVDPTVPMNGKVGGNELFSGPVTVTIEVKKK